MLFRLAVIGCLLFCFSGGSRATAIDDCSDTAHVKCAAPVTSDWWYGYAYGGFNGTPTQAARNYFSSEGDALAYAFNSLNYAYAGCPIEVKHEPSLSTVAQMAGVGTDDCVGDADTSRCTTLGVNSHLVTRFWWHGTAPEPTCVESLHNWMKQTWLGAYRSVSCPAGFWPNNVTAPLRTYCYTNAPIIVDKNVCTGPDCCPSCGDPIYPATGAKWEIVQDIRAAPGSKLSLSRYYNSKAMVSRNAFDWTDSGVGHGWRHSYSRRLRVVDGVGMSTVFADRQGQQRHYFNKIGSTWVADADVHDRLTEVLDTSSVRIGWTYFDSTSAETETYRADGYLTRIDYRDGDYLLLSYDNRMRLLTVVDKQGRKLSFAYAGIDVAQTDQVLSVTDSTGAVYGYGYDATSKNLTSVSYPGGPSYVYHYENTSFIHALTGITDVKADATSTRFSWDEYDTQGRATRNYQAGFAGDTTVSYGNMSAVAHTVIAGSVGFDTTYSFVAVQGRYKGASSSRTCPSCSPDSSATTFDANGARDLHTDASGVITDTDFDANGLLTQVIRGISTPVQQIETRLWDTALRVPTQIDRDGQRQSFTYNSRGQALTASVSVPNPAPGQLPRTTTMAYCEAAGVTAGTCPRLGLLLSVDGPRTDVTDVTTYTYYPSDDATCATAPTTCLHRKGDLWKVTNAAGQVSEVLAYDGAGRVLSSKDPNGVVTDREYQPRGWLTAQKVRGLDNASEADDAITRLTYDGVGQVTRVTQPDGAFTAFTYDAAHRLTTIADSLSNSVTYTLDNAGNRIEEKTKTSGGTLKRSLARVYNGLGQMQTLADALATPTDFTYDLNGNVDTVKDALNRITDNDYDPLNRLKTSIVNATGVAPDKATTQFQYDARDNLTTVIDPKGLSTVYSYNGLDDLKTLTSPDTGITSYDYDTAGNRTGQVDARGTATMYGYDVLNRLISQSVPTAAQNVTFAYDAPPADCQTGETFGAGRLARITDESGTTRYCYNRLGQLVRKVQAVTSGPVLTVGTTYTGANRLVAMTYPSGAIVTYLRDVNGQITGISAKPTATATQVTLVSGATYLPFGPLNTLTFGNGRVVTKAYDQNYGIDKVSDAATGGISEDFTLNVVGNVTGLVERTTATANTTRGFTYDGQDRLTALKNGTTVVQGFTYDATGNRLSKNLSGTITTNTIDPASHRLTQTGTTVLTYDANGNQIKNGTPAFVYDDRNRLRDYKANGTALTRTYRYNGKGERVSKTVAAGNTNNRYYTYDESGHLLGEYLASGVRVQEYVWMDDALVAVFSDHDATTYQYVQTDHLGTPRAVINPVSNAIIWRWNLTNTAFGEHAPVADPDGNSISYTFNLRYPGQWYDSESKLHYNTFRDYDPGTGRYSKSDPIGLRGGMSSYSYAYSSPYSFSDPLGLSPDCKLKRIDNKSFGEIRSREIKRTSLGGGCYPVPKIHEPQPTDLLPDPKPLLRPGRGRYVIPIPSPIDFDVECFNLYWRKLVKEEPEYTTSLYYEVCIDDCGNSATTYVKSIDSVYFFFKGYSYDLITERGISTVIVPPQSNRPWLD